MIGGDGRMNVSGEANIAGAWVLSNESVTPTGEVFARPANRQACGRERGMGSCREWLATLDLRQDLVYQPAENFWPLQVTEAGILAAAVVLLAGFCFWWTRRRLV